VQSLADQRVDRARFAVHRRDVQPRAALPGRVVGR
jgi:hypothetical protein